MVKIHKGCCSNYSRLMRVLQTHYPSQRPAKNKVSGGKQNYPKVIRWSSFSPAQPSPPPKKSGVEKGKELPRLVSQLTAICCDYNSSNKKLLILRWEVYTEKNSLEIVGILTGILKWKYYFIWVEVTIVYSNVIY